MEAVQQDGHVKFKNGNNRWSKPVVFTDDDRIFPSCQTLAIELGVQPPDVSDALHKNSGPLAGHVRFATLVEVRERLMTEKAGGVRAEVGAKGRVYLRGQGVPKRLLSYQGRVMTVKELAAELEEPKKTVISRADRGIMDVRDATLEEAQAHLSKSVTMDPGELVGVPSVFEDPETVTEVPPAPFIGVIWPDGQVTVRLAEGGQWSMTRATVDDLPPEIKVDCAWLS